MTFVPKQSASLVHVKSNLRRGGLFDYEIDIPEKDPNVCRDGNPNNDWGKVDCPLEPGKRYSYVIDRAFPVSTSFNVSLCSTPKVTIAPYHKLTLHVTINSTRFSDTPKSDCSPTMVV